MHGHRRHFIFVTCNLQNSTSQDWGANRHDHMVVGIRLPVQSVPMTTKVVSLNPTHSEVCSIQCYVIKWLVAGRWFSPGTPVSSTNKTDCHNITEILLKVALNTTNLIKTGTYLYVIATKTGTYVSIYLLFFQIYILHVLNLLKYKIKLFDFNSQCSSRGKCKILWIFKRQMSYLFPKRWKWSLWIHFCTLGIKSTLQSSR